jgi:hypothetical protein
MKSITVSKNKNIFRNFNKSKYMDQNIKYFKMYFLHVFIHITVHYFGPTNEDYLKITYQ